MHTLKLPIKWMAIESIVDKIFSVKTDVWAFGITVWEVYSYGAIPCVFELHLRQTVGGAVKF